MKRLAHKLYRVTIEADGIDAIRYNVRLHVRDKNNIATLLHRIYFRFTASWHIGGDPPRTTPPEIRRGTFAHVDMRVVGPMNDTATITVWAPICRQHLADELSQALHNAMARDLQLIYCHHCDTYTADDTRLHCPNCYNTPIGEQLDVSA